MGGAQLFAVGEFIVAGVGAYGGHTRTQAARLLTVVPRRVLITRGWDKKYGLRAPSQVFKQYTVLKKIKISIVVQIYFATRNTEISLEIISGPCTFF
jgi:hypothetical protein